MVFKSLPIVMIIVVYEVIIDRLDHQGRGIGKIKDKIVFVPNALVGEVVKVEIVNEKKKFYEGRVVDYIKTSPFRVKSDCPYYLKCGGCDLLHMPYEKQLSFKENKVKDIMKRYGSFDDGLVKGIVASENVFNYRNKVTFHVGTETGFFAKSTNDIIEIDKCLLISENMNNILFILKNNLLLNDIEKFVIKDMGKCQLMLTIYLRNDVNLDYLDKLLENKVTTIVKVFKNNAYFIRGNGNIIANLGDYIFKVSSDSFFQVNRQQTVKLYEKIKEYCALKKSDKVLDLYCGTGTIGIYLSAYCDKVLGVEINKDAVKDALENKRINGVKNIDFLEMDSKRAIKKVAFKPDVVVVDPPRAGIEMSVVKDIIELESDRVVYVSCDPITLARDLKLFSLHYNVVEIIPFDMFPNTSHVECVVLLHRRKK